MSARETEQAISVLEDLELLPNVEIFKLAQACVVREGASIRPGILLGLGLGGFLDGIVLHQILQWHHMVSDDVTVKSVAGLEDNTLADGIFHAVTWLVTVIGSIAAVKAWRNGEIAPPWSVHLGALIAGWGVFNLIDSVNHFVLGLHHIRDDLGGPVGWDIGFLVLALVQIAGGMAAVRRGRSAGGLVPSSGVSRFGS